MKSSQKLHWRSRQQCKDKIEQHEDRSYLAERQQRHSKLWWLFKKVSKLDFKLTALIIQRMPPNSSFMLVHVLSHIEDRIRRPYVLQIELIWGFFVTSLSSSTMRLHSSGLSTTCGDVVSSIEIGWMEEPGANRCGSMNTRNRCCWVGKELRRGSPEYTGISCGSICFKWNDPG